VNTIRLLTTGSTETLAAVFDILVESNAISNVQYGVLILLAISSLSVYGIIIAG